MTPINLSSRPLNVVFMGTPGFAVPSLEALVKAGHHVRAAVTQPDRPKGRGRMPAPPPVKNAALALGLEVLQPERVSNTEFCEKIKTLCPDVIVVVAFGQLLKKPLLEMAPLGAVNIHASLLPGYRGAAPIAWAIINGETLTGLSTMKLDEGMDTGPVLLQQAIPIGQDDTSGALHDRLASISGPLLLRTLEGLAEGTLEPKPQDNSHATYAPKIDASIRRISWPEPAEKICSVIRGLDPSPGAVTSFEGRDLKVFSPVSVVSCKGASVPGRVRICSSGVFEVEAGRGAVRIGSAQLEGRKRMDAGDFLRGSPLREGMILGPS